MGLDSVVILKTHRKIDEHDIPEWVHFYYEVQQNTHGEWEYELSYFRKCWMIHDLMMEFGNAENNGDWNGERIDLMMYRDGLMSIFSDPGEFNDRSQVFSINEELGSIGQSILNCNWAIDYMQEHHDAYVEFVDSY